jgi:hypothetical protein
MMMDMMAAPTQPTPLTVQAARTREIGLDLDLERRVEAEQVREGRGRVRAATLSSQVKSGQRAIERGWLALGRQREMGGRVDGIPTGW